MKPPPEMDFPGGGFNTFTYPKYLYYPKYLLPIEER